MGSYAGRIHDPDTDGTVKLPPKQVPMTRVPWLLVGVAFMSVALSCRSICSSGQSDRDVRGSSFERPGSVLLLRCRLSLLDCAAVRSEATICFRA